MPTTTRPRSPEVVCSSFPRGCFTSQETFEAFIAAFDEFPKGEYLMRRTDTYVRIHYFEDSEVERRLEDLRKAPR